MKNMKTTKEALDVVLNQLNEPFEGLRLWDGDVINIIIRALGWRVPKAPTATPHKDEGGNKYSGFYCSGCGNGLGNNRYGRLYNVHMESVNDYCENCGQAIEWEGCE